MSNRPVNCTFKETGNHMSTQRSLTGLKYPASLRHIVIDPCTISAIGLILTITSMVGASYLIEEKSWDMALLNTVTLGMWAAGVTGIATGLVVMLIRAISTLLKL